mgnify:CR=1 FL=1
MSAVFHWQGAAVAFRPGESVGSALARAGFRDLGASPVGGAQALFCGIGQCQSCLVLIDGQPTEACLARAVAGAQVQPLEARDV